MERDNTKMREMLGYAMFRMAGVAAPRTAYARVTVNGEYLGLFLAVEQIDEEFARHSFPDGGKGALFREIWPQGKSAAAYETAMEFGNDKSAAAMQRFDEDMIDSPIEEFLPLLKEWTDFKTLMKFLAVDRIIDNFDGYVGWYCSPQPCFNHNFYWYKEAFSDRVWLIPWDLDSSFNYPSPIRTSYGMPEWDVPPNCSFVKVFFGITGRPPSCDPFIHRLAQEAWHGYVEASRELLDGPFELEKLRGRIDQYSALIAETVAEDPNGPSAIAWETAVTKLKSDLGPMRAYIERKIAK